jgi:hypothetical protein
MRHASASALICAAFIVSSSISRGSAAPGISLNVVGGVAFDRDNVFGWEFTPNVDVDVSALGFFDVTSLLNGSGAGLNLSHDVGIFRVADQALIASTTVPAGTSGELVDHFRYEPLPVLTHLSAHTLYEIAGFVKGGGIGADPIAAAQSWTLPAPISYSNPTGVAQFLVSAKGMPPPTSLTFAGIPQTGILPAFAGNFQFALPPHPLPGDANSDGIVNSQDIALIASSWLATGINPADINADGIVNAQDIALVASNWLQTSGPGMAAAAAVPEPSALPLLLSGGAAILLRTCRRQVRARPRPFTDSYRKSHSRKYAGDLCGST